jgi:hypothetical protein
MARDPEYVAGYRDGYHGNPCDPSRSQHYQDGYTNGRGNRAGDDWANHVTAIERAEDANVSRPWTPAATEPRKDRHG